MDPVALLTRFGPYAGTALYCFLGGLIPIFNIEALMVLLATTTDASRHWLVLTLVATVAHMGAKALLYGGGRGLTFGLGDRAKAGVAKAERQLQQWRFGPSAFVFASASLGFPPFYAVSVLAGTLRLGLLRFFLAGFAGRFLRFAAFLLVPQFCMRLLGWR
jgi:membrane protein YqaA with SNARE-associated domain